MKGTHNNPPNNKLGSGLKKIDVLEAVSKSGYPLQTTIANLLRTKFHVQEEWSYIDKDTQGLRTMDILAEKRLYDFTQIEPRVRPSLTLLVECKQSELPYVFFLSSGKQQVPYFPLLAGLFKNTLDITTDDNASSYEFSLLDALGLNSHPFLIKEPQYCMSFTKCVRKGSNLELSGSESYHGIIMPILKAMNHYQKIEEPGMTAFYFDIHIIIGIGVLDAPMIGVEKSKKSQNLMLTPWIRAVRHKTDKIPDWRHRTRLFAIDIIHKDFLQPYLDNHILPFAEDFSKLSLKHQHVLASGKAFVKGMGKDPWRNIEKRLEPRKISARINRSRLIGKNIFRFLTGRKSKNE